MQTVLAAPAQPVIEVKATSKRIYIIDALRGFALFGIILIHASNRYQNIADASGTLTSLDNMVANAVTALFNLKASSLFAFLFGLSFAIQIQSAQAKGKPFTARFLWRLTTLLFIGYLHRLFATDILQVYAVWGLILVACANLKNRTLLILSGLIYSASLVAKFFTPQIDAFITPVANAAENSTVLSFMALDKIDVLVLKGRAFIVPALFLLGLYAGRKNLFSDTPENRALFKKMLVWSIVAVIASTGAYYAGKLSHAVSKNVIDVFYSFRQMSQVLLYLAALVILYRIKFFHKILHLLVPAGQMGLTIYIMQSVILVLFFSFDAAIISKIGMVACMCIATFFFICQVVFAHWWMLRFRYGPVEWLWRTLVYFKPQPFRRND